MRIISQDGMVDVPYERVVIKMSDNPRSVAISALFEREDYMKDIVMGYYSTKEKALKVMEMVRNAYELHTAFKILGSRNGLMTSLNEVFGSMEESAKRISPIFQFPKDDEVEV